MSEDYTYHRPLVVGKNGALFRVVHADEFDALAEQMAKLTQRVNALEQAQRPQPANVVTVVDWEDNL